MNCFRGVSLVKQNEICIVFDTEKYIIDCVFNLRHLLFTKLQKCKNLESEYKMKVCSWHIIELFCVYSKDGMSVFILFQKL